MPVLLAVARFELRFHRRELLTWLAGAVFFLLTFGFMASGAVELVGDRGAAPKHAPWTIAHAMAGVTAFGQVMVTLIAATAVLRDEAARTRALYLTTPITRLQYVGGRLAGTLLVLLLVHLAIPLGLLAGALLPGGAALPAPGAVARPFGRATCFHATCGPASKSGPVARPREGRGEEGAILPLVVRSRRRPKASTSSFWRRPPRITSASPPRPVSCRTGSAPRRRRPWT